MLGTLMFIESRNEKTRHFDLHGKVFKIRNLFIGKTAILPETKVAGSALLTSEIESVELNQGVLVAKTDNMIYTFNIE